MSSADGTEIFQARLQGGDAPPGGALQGGGGGRGGFGGGRGSDYSSPVISSGEIFFRSNKHLYCVSSSTATTN